MNKLFLALAFAGVSQASFISCTPNHSISSGQLCAGAPRDSTIPMVTAKDSFSASLVVPDGPDSAYIVFSGVIIGNLDDSRFRSGGRADVSTLLGTSASIPELNFLPSPADPCCGSGMLQTMSYLYTRGVPFPFSVELEVISNFGGTAVAEVLYQLRLEQRIYGPSGGYNSIPRDDLHIETVAAQSPEPATLLTAGAMLFVWVIFRASRDVRRST